MVEDFVFDAIDNAGKITETLEALLNLYQTHNTHQTHNPHWAIALPSAAIALFTYPYFVQSLLCLD